MRKRLFSLGLCLVVIFQLFLIPPVIASAANEVLIITPEPGNAITGDYVVRFSISNMIQPKNIAITYLDQMGVVATVPVPVNSTSVEPYKMLIQEIGNGDNTIKVQVETLTGEIFTDERQVKVNRTTTNIMMGPENTEPYISDPNKLKNILKDNNTATAKEHGLIPKDNAFVGRFVDILVEEATAEGVRPDVVFAQIMLETGWLSYRYTVTENQNNFGGIGATGNGVQGNLFQSMRDGIRVNVQHLKGYASTKNLNGVKIDPRFFVKRGSAPSVEYLGYYENVNDAGWAMAKQYGYTILNVMERINKAAATPFITKADAPVITEFVVKPIIIGDNPLNVNFGGDYTPGKPIRLAVATNSYTEHCFTIINQTTGTTKTTPWSEAKAIFYVPEQAGVYQFLAEVRTKGSVTAQTNRTTEIKIGTVENTTPPVSTTTPSTTPSTTTPPTTTTPVNPDKEVIPAIGSLTLSSPPYIAGKDIGITIKDSSEATARVNEYQIEVELGGSKSLLNPWSSSRTFKFTPKEPGDYLIRVLSRNKLVGGDAKQSATISFKVTASNEPMDLIASVSASDPTIYKGRTYQIKATPVPNPGISVQYQLVKKGSSGDTVLSDWTSSSVFSYTPDQTGTVNLEVKARNQAGDGTVLNSKGLKLDILEMSIYSPAGYVPTNPYGIQLSNIHIAGLKSNGRNLIFSALATSNPGLLYRFYLINQETGSRTLVKDWSTSTQANWRAAFGHQKLVVEVKHPNSTGYWDAKLEMDLRIKNYPTVFLDPGHGGSDPGYVVYKNGTTYRESALTLDMASLIRTKLQGRGINVINSRYTNEFVSLDNRINKARNSSADLFITLHYTASSNSSTKGVRTYYSGLKSDPLANLFLAEGKEAAELVGPSMAYYYTSNRGVGSEQDTLGYNIRVLKDTTMPSLQLNLGYLTNAEDLSRIQSSWYRNLIAQRIADSIMVYFNNN